MDTIRRLESLRRDEHEATVELITALVACAEKEEHVAAGHASIWALLVERLRYSPAAASRRNAAVKIAARHPVALEMLRSHRTSLTCLAKIAYLLPAEDFARVLEAIDGKSAEDVDRLLAARRPQRRPRERVKRTVVRIQSSAAELKTSLGLEEPKPSKVPTPPIEERVELRLSLSGADYERFQRARAKASRKHGPGVSIEATLCEMLNHYVDRVPRARETKPSTRRTRHVPNATRRAVFARDGHRCSFVSEDGTRCSVTHDLQVDHVERYAHGGSHDVENLRLLCGAHNRWRERRM